MQLKKGEIYYYQEPNSYGTFIKIIDNFIFIQFISSTKYDNIKDVNINNYSFVKYYKDDVYICDNNSFNVVNKLNNKFKTYEEEIFNKFNNNIGTWQRIYNITDREEMKGNYHIRYRKLSYISSNSTLIVNNTDFKKWGIDINKRNIFFTKDDIISIERDKLINELCN